MKKYIILTGMLMTGICGIYAQQEKKQSIKFNSINSIGLLSGEIQNKFTLQTINGLQYKSWFAGLGASLDNYGYRSIPAFIDIRKTFGHKEWLPFVYVDGGINFSLYSSDLPRKLNNKDAYKLKNTFYGEAGFGVNRKLNRKIQFNFSIGYSYKHLGYLQYDVGGYGIILNNQMSPPTITQYDFYYRRIAIKTGLQFQF